MGSPTTVVNCSSDSSTAAAGGCGGGSGSVLWFFLALRHKVVFFFFFFKNAHDWSSSAGLLSITGALIPQVRGRGHAPHLVSQPGMGYLSHRQGIMRQGMSTQGCIGRWFPPTTVVNCSSDSSTAAAGGCGGGSGSVLVFPGVASQGCVWVMVLFLHR